MADLAARFDIFNSSGWIYWQINANFIDKRFSTKNCIFRLFFMLRTKLRLFTFSWTAGRFPAKILIMQYKISQYKIGLKILGKNEVTEWFILQIEILHIITFFRSSKLFLILSKLLLICCQGEKKGNDLIFKRDLRKIQINLTKWWMSFDLAI